MKFEKMQELIDDIIAAEFECEEYKNIENRKFDSLKLEIDDLMLNFEKILSEETYKLLVELINKESHLSSLENQYYFNRGVRTAFTRLSFLKKYSNVF